MNDNVTMTPAQPGFYAVWNTRIPPFTGHILYPLVGWRVSGDDVWPVAMGLRLGEAASAAVLCPDGQVFLQAHAARSWPNLESYLRDHENELWREYREEQARLAAFEAAEAIKTQAETIAVPAPSPEAA